MTPGPWKKKMDPEELKRRLELEKLMGVHVLFKREAMREVEDETAEELEALDENYVKGCRKCRLHEGRKNTVFGRGNPHAELMFVGEAPGADEDEEGVPFVGRAGTLLDKMVFAMGLTRDEIFIANIIKCRPPDNRDPRADEVEACMPYLERQIELVEPTLICTLGLPASKTLLDSNKAMWEMRGNWSRYKGIPVLPTYHPAYLLRSPGQKKKAWKDLKMVMKALEEGPPAETSMF